MTQIRLEKVSKNFGEDKAVLTDIDLEVEKDEFVAIVGPSGAGKTTLLRLIADFEEPTGGQISLPSGNRSDVGFMFQDQALFPWKTARGNIKFALNVSDQEDNTEKIEDILETVGLLDAASKYPHELSGGMKQRLAFARTLAHDPKLILMDEPFSSLDELTKRRLYREFREILQETQKTIIFVTHDIKEAYLFSDRIFTLTGEGKMAGDIQVKGEPPRDLDVLESKDFRETRKEVLERIGEAE